jgi:hypothetical protein
MNTESVPLVRNADNMDDETFVMHMNSRHAGNLGGLEELNLDHASPYVVHCWRLFHNTIHRIFTPDPLDDHEHGEYHAEPISDPGIRPGSGPA